MSRGILSRGILSGGFCPGGFCPGGFCPDTQLTLYELVRCQDSFSSGLARSYLDFLLSFDYPVRVLIPLKVIAKASRTSGILSTL